MLRHFLQWLSYNRNTADIVYRLNFSKSSQPVYSLSTHAKSIFFLLPVHILRSALSQHPHISQMLHSLLHHHNISFSFVRPFLCLNCFGSQLSFRIMKTEFKARPVYLSRKDRITAHFTTCFTALVIYRILEHKLNEKYTCEELIDTIRSMDMLIAPGEGYIPTYTRTDITDALHDAFGFRTDYQITSQRNMRKILNQTKKKGK